MDMDRGERVIDLTIDWEEWDRKRGCPRPLTTLDYPFGPMRPFFTNWPAT